MGVISGFLTDYVAASISQEKNDMMYFSKISGQNHDVLTFVMTSHMAAQSSIPSYTGVLLVSKCGEWWQTSFILYIWTVVSLNCSYSTPTRNNNQNIKTNHMSSFNQVHWKWNDTKVHRIVTVLRTWLQWHYRHVI